MFSGSLSNIKIVNAPSLSLGKKAMEIVSSMPKWNSGKQRGKAVKVDVSLNIEFI